MYIIYNSYASPVIFVSIKHTNITKNWSLYFFFFSSSTSDTIENKKIMGSIYEVFILFGWNDYFNNPNFDHYHIKLNLYYFINYFLIFFYIKCVRINSHTISEKKLCSRQPIEKCMSHTKIVRQYCAQFGGTFIANEMKLKYL